ncbi:MAG: NAD-dependent epimerase/dehydratase family protein [Clostridia bacterium]|nr:NAD-dependent epimerase/dehydratase family protein [Clostridia bacterium]
MAVYLVTGCAGFIGSKVAEMLIEGGHVVVGIDNLNDYYDINLKYYRLDKLKNFGSFTFYKIDIENYTALETIFKSHKFDAVINEAARAGVRYSIKNPHIYLSTNAGGTLNLLELCRRYDVPKFILASTSSLYAGQKMPFNENLPVNTPISPYAASKKAAEMLAYSYHYLYGLDVTVLRYFTVYGPSGRPDMSIFRFIKWAMESRPIEIFGDGNQSRDFTYIEDIARGTVLALKPMGFQIINLGNNNPDKLINVIKIIEKYIGTKAKLVYKDFHKADLYETWANIDKAEKLLGWQPNICLEEGIKKTVEWFKENWYWLKKVKI